MLSRLRDTWTLDPSVKASGNDGNMVGENTVSGIGGTARGIASGCSDRMARYRLPRSAIAPVTANVSSGLDRLWIAAHNYGA